jgi:hypothetical protein
MIEQVSQGVGSSPRGVGGLLGVWLLLAVIGMPAMAETLTGRVVGVQDGDTLTLLVGRQPVKVRLAGIDAPELAQPYGQKAKQALSDRAYGKEARVESAGPDRYGRTLGTEITSFSGFSSTYGGMSYFHNDQHVSKNGNYQRAGLFAAAGEPGGLGRRG